MDLSGNLLLVSLVTRPGIGVTCRLKRGTGAQVWLDIGWICFELGNFYGFFWNVSCGLVSFW